MDPFDCMSPLDFRYLPKALLPYLSENGATQYRLRAELALIRVLRARGIISSDEIVQEIEAACRLVTTAEVYEEEGRIKHDIRALANCIRDRCQTDEARRFVHMLATSYDIIDTANPARYRDAMCEVMMPALDRLLGVLIRLAKREAETVQVGRTHGQHAVPITFGFAIAQIVSRLGGSIQELRTRTDQLVGKFSGPVGAYNGTSLIISDPRGFERDVLAEMGLQPGDCSTQIAHPEPLMRLLQELGVTAGILGNLARNMRHLQRTEIGEVGEAFGAEQVGSSTMPQKRNPINFENIEGMWKIVMGRLVTVGMDQASEHERDLTGSVSGRSYGEIIAYVYEMITRMTRVMEKLVVDHEALVRNFSLTRGGIAAEPLYIILAYLGHPDAHEAVRLVAQGARDSGRPLLDVLRESTELAPYLAQMTPEQLGILEDPARYIGHAVQVVHEVCDKYS